MGSPIWVDQKTVATQLRDFFGNSKEELAAFGSTVNQTFEAFVVAQVVAWYKAHGWKITLVPPIGEPAGTVKLKFNTRGRPSAYTHALCEKDGNLVQIRHGLRVATRHNAPGQRPSANVCLDVSVIKDTVLSGLKSDDFLENERLVTFGEAKHMSAFAELVANFIGLVHEMLPENLRNRSAGKASQDHLAPFLYVSGIMYPTARGIIETLSARGVNLSVYDHTDTSFSGKALPTVSPPKRTPSTKSPKALPAPSPASPKTLKPRRTSK